MKYINQLLKDSEEEKSMWYLKNISLADLAEMGSFSSKNENIKYASCAIDYFIKYAWVKALKNKKR